MTSSLWIVSSLAPSWRRRLTYSVDVRGRELSESERDALSGLRRLEKAHEVAGLAAVEFDGGRALAPGQGLLAAFSQQQVEGVVQRGAVRGRVMGIGGFSLPLSDDGLGSLPISAFCRPLDPFPILEVPAVPDATALEDSGLLPHANTSCAYCSQTSSGTRRRPRCPGLRPPAVRRCWYAVALAHPRAWMTSSTPTNRVTPIWRADFGVPGSFGRWRWALGWFARRGSILRK